MAQWEVHLSASTDELLPLYEQWLIMILFQDNSTNCDGVYTSMTFSDVLLPGLFGDYWVKKAPCGKAQYSEHTSRLQCFSTELKKRM